VTADRLLHLAARILLRTCTPLTARAVLKGFGGLLPQRRTRDEVVRAAVGLGQAGTCLSRALAVTARAPGATVVIGVQHEQGRPLLAHAWIEVEGLPLNPTDPLGTEIARLN
jgi:Transglutaminase-like superfamily